MKRIFCLFAFTLAPGNAVYADWKIVTRAGGGTVTEFVKGALVRTELPPHTTVQDFERRRQFDWRNDLRQYAVIEWPPQRQGDSSSRVITIERNTTDTGERKRFFGRTGRHLITRMTRSGGPESVIDAWYIDVPGLPRWKSGAGGGIIMDVEGGDRGLSPPRIEFKQTGPAPEGLAVWQKTSFSVGARGGSHDKYEFVSEVTELAEVALRDNFFQPPDGYQRVASLPPRPETRTWAELLRAHWQKIEAWFSTVF